MDKRIRPSFTETFFSVAHSMSLRSTCLRRQIGAIAVRGTRILATGYNGPPSGFPHCEKCIREEAGIPSGQRHELCMAIHAEENLVIQCAMYGTKMWGTDVFVENKPCSRCLKMLIEVGVKHIWYLDDYTDSVSDKIIEMSGRVVIHQQITSRTLAYVITEP